MIILLRPRQAQTAPPATPCQHPADALTTRRAGLSRTVVQTCQCGRQWTVQP
ncbi:hypothetical protein [Parafrankia sp. EUN1f]|uniref:hypothetical protein n=1 Tax=Parafrankia sp. EUN1f TaxID=102897 RepID=UPI0001C46462|nr:hypothetical protein [Parafrankia sp. EUN1f]EFC80898.1 hypothetical protein FrEUN1fDRAFT_6000 [Parafrankia sp. EUN1f]